MKFTDDPLNSSQVYSACVFKIGDSGSAKFFKWVDRFPD